MILRILRYAFFTDLPLFRRNQMCRTAPKMLRLRKNKLDFRITNPELRSSMTNFATLHRGSLSPAGPKRP